MLIRLIMLICLPVDVQLPPVDFDTQVMPILTKAGCNAGACHGAAAGRGEFHLSLYGSRPGDDYDEIVRAFEGRRINSANPELSLLLQKPTEQLSHEGGTRIEIGGTDFNTIQRWIHEGASRYGHRRLISFQFRSDASAAALPPQIDSKIQLQTLATFDDGAVESVIPWTVFTPDDPSAVEVSSDGVAILRRSGRHVVLARYLDRVAALELIVPVNKLTDAAISDSANGDLTPPRSDQRHSDQARSDQFSEATAIDSLIDAKLLQLGLIAAPPASDTQLVRRLSLDLTGRLPTLAMLDAFVADTSATRIQRFVDQLLVSDEFTDFWAFRLAGMLRINPNAPRAYFDWVHQCVKDDRPYNQFARDLLLAQGSLQQNGPANFYPVGVQPRATAELASSVFLGVQMQCANCHDHPLDSWTQDDYHGLAAIFAKVNRGPVVSVGNGYVVHPQTAEPAISKLPGGDFLSSNDEVDPRQLLADWLTDSDNPYFRRAIANRVWQYLMGRGLVEPIDDLRATNPATHPELLQWLADDFAQHNHSLRHMIRSICLSRAYQRATRTSKTQFDESAFYSAAISRVLNPAVFLDAVNDVTLPENTPRERLVSMSGLIVSSGDEAPLSQCQMGADCSLDTLAVNELAVQLQFLNGEVINKSLRDPSGALMRELASESTTTQIVERFYRKAYSRSPSLTELDYWQLQFSKVEGDTAANERANLAQDFLWSLLNSTEFLTNH